MAGGGPVTGCLAARAAATAGLLAGHLVDVAAAEGGGGREGGIADVPVPRDRKVTLVGVEVEVGVTGEKALGRSLGVVPEVVVALAPKVTSRRGSSFSRKREVANFIFDRTEIVFVTSPFLDKRLCARKKEYF